MEAAEGEDAYASGSGGDAAADGVAHGGSVVAYPDLVAAVVERELHHLSLEGINEGGAGRSCQ